METSSEREFYLDAEGRYFATRNPVDPVEQRRKAGIPKMYLKASLDRFEPKSEKEKKVYAELADYAECPQKFPTGLILVGNVGTGKTHFACALVNHFLEQERSAFYIRAVDIFRGIKSTWNPNSEKTEAEEVKFFSSRNVFLAIDELGVQFSSETERALLTEILDKRHTSYRPTILVGNLTPIECSELVGERIVDRYREGGKVLVFDWESHRGKEKAE